MSSHRSGSTLTHTRLGKLGQELLSEIVEKMTEVCEKFRDVSGSSFLASVSQVSSTEREMQRRRILEHRRVINHHFGVLSMIYRKLSDRIPCKETSLKGLIPLIDGENVKEPQRTKQIEELRAERDRLRVIVQMKSEQMGEALRIMRLLLQDINIDSGCKVESRPKVGINPMKN
ncbi:Oidioi.mRNA.OKI2018_I69.chr1.g3145.t1.cds [Oikopleura dioica]|uniref:Mediator of RNA polymerase II transcription subunit 30 n=1 Tax=Oikopleura dioica TaxID=34765 RepID=A0ABN7SV05_OIKDI|nr:Oidioi.mRNA.OKI2018_I69.chr1.g3145.t1.cds [Oikopleura dioica]